MSLVSQVIDRLYREYLHPASDQPTRARLNTTLDTTTATVVFNLTNILTPEEIDLFGEGVIIEIDQEWMLVTAWASPNATVVRAWGGTTAAAHTAGAVIYLAPQMSRLAVFNAVCDAIVDLYPDLYVSKNRLYPSSADPVDIDPLATEVHSYRWQDTDGRLRPGTAEFIPDFGGTKIQFGPDVPTGRDGYLTYYSKFPRPTAESDDLDDENGDWAIPEEWVKVIMVDAFTTLLATRQGDQLNTDFIVELLVREGFDANDSRTVISSLLALRNEWVRRARSRLQQQTNIRVELKRR
jgi:hypothetical protein